MTMNGFRIPFHGPGHERRDALIAFVASCIAWDAREGPRARPRPCGGLGDTHASSGGGRVERLVGRGSTEVSSSPSKITSSLSLSRLLSASFLFPFTNTHCSPVSLSPSPIPRSSRSRQETNTNNNTRRERHTFGAAGASTAARKSGPTPSRA